MGAHLAGISSATGAVALTGIGKFQFLPPQMAGAVILGVTLLIGGLAIRRLARVG